MFTVDIPHGGIVYSTRFPWKVGFVSYMPQFPDNVANIRKVAEDPFFDSIEVGALSDGEWSRVEILLEGKVLVRGLQPDIHTWKPEFSLSSFDDDARKSAIKLIKKEIDVAASRGVEVISLISGLDPGPIKRSRSKRIFAESLKEICAYSQEHEIHVVIEPQDRLNKNLLIGPLNDAVDVLKDVRDKRNNIGLLWDLSHAPILNETVNDLDEVRDLLTHVHIGCAKKVNDRYIDTHPGFFTPGAINGVEEVSELLMKLLAIKYSVKRSSELNQEYCYPLS